MPYDPCLNIVMYQPEIPYNAGSVGRTCVAIGAKLWLVRPIGFRLDAYHLRRAGLDYWQHLNWEVVEDWAALKAALPSQRYFYFTKFGKTCYTQKTYEKGDVFVFGRESNGLPEELLSENPDHNLIVPIRKEVRSLNLSVTVAVAGYEALRQWNTD